jgi:hypothetical protein
MDECDTMHYNFHYVHFCKHRVEIQSLALCHALDLKKNPGNEVGRGIP